MTADIIYKDFRSNKIIYIDKVVEALCEGLRIEAIPTMTSLVKLAATNSYRVHMIPIFRFILHNHNIVNIQSFFTTLEQHISTYVPSLISEYNKTMDASDAESYALSAASAFYIIMNNEELTDA